MTNIHFTKEDIEKCLLAKNIIEKEFRYHLTQDELARRVCLNCNKLKAGFKQFTGETIYQFTTKLRVEKAKELLTTTDLPVEVIAARLGLDHSNLIRRFKKYTGSTPKEWRFNNRNHQNNYTQGL